MVVYNDSEATIAYTKDPKYNKKTKHIDMRFNYVRDLTTQKELNMVYISTHEMLVDSFTKPIPWDVFRKHMESIGLRKILCMIHYFEILNHRRICLFSIHTYMYILIMMLSAFNKGMSDEFEINPFTRVVFLLNCGFIRIR